MELVSFSQKMNSFFLILIEDPIFLDLKVALLLDLSKIFKSALDFFSHKGKKIGLSCYIVEFR